jgi:hypothetical protein
MFACTTRIPRIPRKLPWPASRIERDVLHELWLEAQRTGQPITAVIKDAVDSHLNRIAAEAVAPSLAMPNQPAAAHATVGHAA